MQSLHTILAFVHVTIGALSLVLFWVPVVARKGGALHRRAGTWFSFAMYAVSGTALAMCVAIFVDPLATRGIDPVPVDFDVAAFSDRNRMVATFLLMLSLLVFTNVRHAELALKCRQSRTAVRRWHHVVAMAALGVSGVAVLAIGIDAGQPLLIIFSLISIAASSGMLRYAFRANVHPNDWRVEHLSGMLGGGVGAYTAFFAFGGSRFFAELLPGNLQIVPWVLPVAIALPVSVWLTRHNRRVSAGVSGARQFAVRLPTVLRCDDGSTPAYVDDSRRAGGRACHDGFRRPAQRRVCRSRIQACTRDFRGGENPQRCDFGCAGNRGCRRARRCRSVNFGVGQILDPVNDLVERFSAVMLVATTSLGLQNILLEMTGWWGVTLALALAALLTIALLWWPGAPERWANFAVRALLVTLFVRFSVGVLIIGSNLVFDTFLAQEQAAAVQALEATSNEIEELNEESGTPAPAEETLLERFGSMLDQSLESLQVSDRLKRFKDSVSNATEHIINLIVIFLLQTVLLPLVFVWLLVEGLKAVAARATRL